MNKYLPLLAMLCSCADDDSERLSPIEVLFIGDSITQDAITPEDASTVRIETHSSGRPIYPVNWGLGGYTTRDFVRLMPNILRDRPSSNVVIIGLGTNDARDGRIGLDEYRESLDRMAATVLASGRRLMLTRIPYSPLPSHSLVPQYNAVVDEVAAKVGCQISADLYSWFLSNPNELSADGIHPTSQGYSSINRLLAEAIYRP